jgi:DNA uptake protein ComE-like DNA-binding protein
LPGISDDEADRIIAGRPYASTRQLVDKRILSRDAYDKIADRVTVQK